MESEIWILKSHISDFWVGVQMNSEIWNLKADFSDFWVGVQMKPETWGGLLKSDQISLLIWTVDQNSEFWILKTEPFFTVDWLILSSTKVREGSQLNTEHIYGSKWGHTEVWYLKCETWSELGTKSEVELGRFNRGRTHIWQQWAARCGSGERAASSLRSSWTWPTTFDAPDFHQASQFRSNFQKSDRKGRGACTHHKLMNKNQKKLWTATPQISASIWTVTLNSEIWRQGLQPSEISRDFRILSESSAPIWKVHSTGPEFRNLNQFSAPIWNQHETWSDFRNLMRFQRPLANFSSNLNSESDFRILNSGPPICSDFTFQASQISHYIWNLPWVRSGARGIQYGSGLWLRLNGKAKGAMTKRSGRKCFTLSALALACAANMLLCTTYASLLNARTTVESLQDNTRTTVESLQDITGHLLQHVLKPVLQWGVCTVFMRLQPDNYITHARSHIGAFPAL